MVASLAQNYRLTVILPSAFEGIVLLSYGICSCYLTDYHSLVDNFPSITTRTFFLWGCSVVLLLCV